MKKITDERLVLRNLHPIKIAYIIQTIGILCILAFDLYQGGVEQMRNNPLWLLFIITTVVMAYLSMSVSVEHEREIKNPKRSLIISLIIVLLIAFALAYFTSRTPGFDWSNGLLIGVIILICGFVPCFYIYRLRMKQLEDATD